MKKRKLRKALKLPFDEALPIVRKAVSADHTVVYRPEVIDWCVQNAKAILTESEARKER